MLKLPIIMHTRLRNRIGFLIFGFSLMFYDGIITASSLDLVLAATKSTIFGVANSHLYNDNTQASSSTNNGTSANLPFCSKLATSAIMIAYYVPGSIIALAYPLLLLSVDTNINCVASIAGFMLGILLTGSLINEAVLLVGVSLLSVSLKVYDVTILLMNEKYGGKLAIQSYGSGSGFGVLFGAVGYVLLREVLSVQAVTLTTIIFPISLFLTQYKLIKRSNDIVIDENSTTQILLASSNDSENTDLTRVLPFNDILKLIPKAAPYFIPTFLCYFILLVSIDLHELVYVPSMKHLDRSLQFRLISLFTSIGFLIGSTSIEIVRIKRVWHLLLVKYIICGVFILYALKIIMIYNYYLVIANVFCQGITTGSIFINSINEASINFEGIHKKYCISFVKASISLGTIFGSFSGFYIRNINCI